MTHTVLAHAKDGHRIATVTQSVIINVPRETIWRSISNIVGLTEWVTDVKKTEFLSNTKRGIGASRKIFFADGNTVTEYVVGWRSGSYLSYIATDGLPLDGYHATLSITTRSTGTHLEWTSYLVSRGSDKKEFDEFLVFIDSFYKSSLNKLKEGLEKTT